MAEFLIPDPDEVFGAQTVIDEPIEEPKDPSLPDPEFFGFEEKEPAAFNEPTRSDIHGREAPGAGIGGTLHKGLRKSEAFRIMEYNFRKGHHPIERGRVGSGTWYGEHTIEDAKRLGREVDRQYGPEVLGKDPTPKFGEGETLREKSISSFRNLLGASANLAPFMLNASIEGLKSAMAAGAAGAAATITILTSTAYVAANQSSRRKQTPAPWTRLDPLPLLS